jgi:hypothetical protein
MEAWREALSQDQGVTGGGQSGPMALLDDAVDHLGLPRRRQERLVRAIRANILALVVDEAPYEGLHESITNRPA